jgi:hypothetical protein
MRALIADLLGRGRSRSMIHNVVAPIRQTFSQLVEDGMLVVNPAEVPPGQDRCPAAD